ncbi:MAG: 50S ribosome-binding GTPase, partial [Clostridia bacterium]|nr:50S ribosome-binding GTPase [Clostridia bacterium]
KIMDAAAHYAAMLDYADEGVEPPDGEAVERLLRDAREKLQELKRGAVAGKVIREGVPVSIVGKTNAGKSTLLNALLGYDRAIVTPVAGTTRDVIEESLSLKGGRIRLTDTAGFRGSEDPVEKIGIEKSRRSLSLAESAILVFDGSVPPGEVAAAAARAVQEEKKRRPELRVFKVLAKSDRGTVSRYEEWFPEEPVFVLSAETGEGLDRLTGALSDMAGRKGSDPAAVTNLRHADAVRRASDLLEEVLRDKKAGMTDDVIWSGLTGVASILGEITGDEVKEDMIERIFRNFCVGK